MLLLVSLLAMLVVLSPASARVPRGSLTQLPGRTGCVSESGAGGCRAARGLAAYPSIPLSAVRFVTVSPDGRNVYAAGRAIAVFSRGKGTGRLSQLRGEGGCVAPASIEPGCATARGGGFPGALAISSDGRNAYATWGDTLVVFARDPETGALTELAGPAGCVNANGRNGCGVAPAMRQPVLSFGGVVVTRDGRNVYLASPGGAVLAFARDSGTGALTQLSGEAGCVGRTGFAGCAPGRLIERPIALATSPGGGSLYVVEPAEPESSDPQGLAVFSRDRQTGALTQLSGEPGCLSGFGESAPSCGNIPNFALPFAVTVSPDGRSVYALEDSEQDLEGNVRVMRRNRQTGALSQPAGSQRCLGWEETAPGDCKGIRTIFAIQSFAVSPDGSNAYVGGFGDPYPKLPGAVEAFARSRNGTLTPISGRAGCVRRGGGKGCKKARALKDARSLAVSPDGRNVYAASGRSASIAVFTRNRR